jgi:hypothetical protein
VDTLAVVVSAMAEAVRDSFAAMGLPLPPWRESRALVSKWLPDEYQDTAVPRRPPSLLLLPPSSLAQSRSSRGSCARAQGELQASRRSCAGASAAGAARAGEAFQPARVVTGFAVPPKRCGGGGDAAAAAAGSGGAGGPSGQAGAGALAAGQVRAAANRDRLAQLLPPMRTVRLGA